MKLSTLDMAILLVCGNFGFTTLQQLKQFSDNYDEKEILNSIQHLLVFDLIGQSKPILDANNQETVFYKVSNRGKKLVTKYKIQTNQKLGNLDHLKNIVNLK